MALIKCDECGKEISDRANSCPGCGAPVVTEESLKQQMIKEEQDEKENAEKIEMKMWGKSVGIIILCLGLLFGGIFYFNSYALNETDKIAYEIFEKGAQNFKNPASVKIISGRINKDKNELYLELSATNSYGGTITEKYIFSKPTGTYFYVKTEKTNSLPIAGGTFNVDKVNKKYQKNLK